MRKNLSAFILCCLTMAAKSQTASVEKTVFGIQTGFFGIWIHNETKLSDQFVLRSELGLDNGIWGSDFYDVTGFLMAPVLTVEPRLYYNLEKRARKSRRIDGNSGNFVSFKTSYHPDWFIISNYDNLWLISDITIIPTWGIRRNIGKHFNYETGVGFVYRYILAKRTDHVHDKIETDLNLHLRIGYRF